MDTQQLRQLLMSDLFVRRLPLVNVCARDHLPRHIDRTQPAALIVNTDTSAYSGSHWIALYFNGLGQFEYFDSFGLPPLHADIIHFIQRNSDRSPVYNTRMLQDINNTTCGLYALYFLLMKCRGSSMSRILQRFGHRQHVNDRLVFRLVTPWLKKTSPELFKTR